MKVKISFKDGSIRTYNENDRVEVYKWHSAYKILVQETEKGDVLIIDNDTHRVENVAKLIEEKIPCDRKHYGKYIADECGKCWIGQECYQDTPVGFKQETQNIEERSF